MTLVNSPFIQGKNRYQSYFTTADKQINVDDAVGLIDAFVDKLELDILGLVNTAHMSEGLPPYKPALLLNLYLYGYLNKYAAATNLKGSAIEKMNCSA